jgi:hypothetical protein
MVTSTRLSFTKTNNSRKGFFLASSIDACVKKLPTLISIKFKFKEDISIRPNERGQTAASGSSEARIHSLLMTQYNAVVENVVYTLEGSV